MIFYGRRHKNNHEFQCLSSFGPLLGGYNHIYAVYTTKLGPRAEKTSTFCFCFQIFLLNKEWRQKEYIRPQNFLGEKLCLKVESRDNQENRVFIVADMFYLLQKGSDKPNCGRELAYACRTFPYLLEVFGNLSDASPSVLNLHTDVSIDFYQGLLVSTDPYWCLQLNSQKQKQKPKFFKMNRISDEVGRLVLPR